jgi:hypothetical protein
VAPSDGYNYPSLSIGIEKKIGTPNDFNGLRNECEAAIILVNRRISLLLAFLLGFNCQQKPTTLYL